MGYLPDGWQRIIRELQTEQGNATYKGFISLEIQNETLIDVPIDTWVSPTTATLFADIVPKNFEYTGGSIVYTGDRRVLIEVEAIQSVSIGGLSATAEVTNGVNNTPCDSGAMPASSAFGGAIPLHTKCRFYVDPNDTIDSFTRQTSEAGGSDITILKGVYHVTIVDIAND